MFLLKIPYICILNIHETYNLSSNNILIRVKRIQHKNNKCFKDKFLSNYNCKFFLLHLKSYRGNYYERLV